MKILIATGIYPPDIGGPATYTVNFAAELKKLGCEVVIITYSDDVDNKNSKSDIPVDKIERKQNKIWRYLKYFLRVLSRADSVDIIYTFEIMSTGLPIILAAWIKNKPVVYRTGGDWLWEKAMQSGRTDLPLAEYYEAKKNIREKILIWFCAKIISRFQAVIFSTKWQADLYRRHYKLDNNKIHFIANPWPKVDAETEVNLGNEFNRSIIFAGRLIKLKNLPRLIKVFCSIDTDCKLILIGQGPEKNSLEALIKSEKISARVEIKAKVGHNELLRIIKNSLFTVLPSYSEISPNLALETLSLNKQIILTKANGLSEDVNTAAILVDPRDENDLKQKIIYLLNPENRAREEEKLSGLNKSLRGWREIAEEHLEIFSNL